MNYGSLNSNNIEIIRDELYLYMYNILTLPHIFPNEEIKNEALKISHGSEDEKSLRSDVRKLIEEIISNIEVPPVDKFTLEERTPCPLCGDIANVPYSNAGFKYPEGLRRHLIGFGNTQQCIIIYTIYELGKNSIISHNRFRK